VIEDDLRNLRLAVAEDSVRDRILAAAVKARNDRRVGRWIHRIALSAVAIALLTVLFGRSGGTRHSSVPTDPDHRPWFAQYPLKEVDP
jgi:hypothetical protein